MKQSSAPLGLSDIHSPWRDEPTGTRSVEARPIPTEAAAALRALGPVVYAIRLPDGTIKIGHSANLSIRRLRLSTNPDDLLAFMPGTLADEQAIHESLSDHVEHGREWYYPTPGVMRVINEMRERIGLAAL